MQLTLNCIASLKLGGVDSLIADPPPANCTTMHGWLVRQDINLCLDWSSLFAWSGNTAVTFEPVVHFLKPF